MKTPELVERLVDLGLPERQANAYVQLHAAGPSKASDIAATNHMSRPQAYRLLEAMSQKGLVSITLGRPLRYVAVPPGQVLEHLQVDYEGRLDRIRRSQTDLVPALQGLRTAEVAAATRPHFRVVWGREEYFRTAAVMIRSAHERICVVSTTRRQPNRRDESGITRLSRMTTPTGVRIQTIINEPDESERSAIRALAQEGPNSLVRYVRGEAPMRFLIKDDDEILLTAAFQAPMPQRSDPEAAIWSDAPELAQTIAVLFQRLWDAGSEVLFEKWRATEPIHHHF